MFDASDRQMVTDVAAIVRLGNRPTRINKKVRRNAVNAILYTPSEISLPQRRMADFGQALASGNRKANPTAPNIVGLIDRLFRIRDQGKRRTLATELLAKFIR